MNVVSFRYDEETWLKLEAIVTRSGGDAARETFAAGRAKFEKTSRPNVCPSHLSILAFHPPTDTDKYKRTERAALELVAALDDLNPDNFLRQRFSMGSSWRAKLEG